MWTKILIFMVVFFLVANPATFKIVRRLLGSWVASAEGLATPAGLILHSAVFVSLAIFLPKALMRASGYQDDDEEYEDEDGEEYEDDDGEEYEDEDGEEYEDDDGEEYEDDPEEFARRRSKRSSRKPKRSSRKPKRSSRKSKRSSRKPKRCPRGCAPIM
jgi:hypothetical protein